MDLENGCQSDVGDTGILKRHLFKNSLIYYALVPFYRSWKVCQREIIEFKIRHNIQALKSNIFVNMGLVFVTHRLLTTPSKRRRKKGTTCTFTPGETPRL